MKFINLVSPLVLGTFTMSSCVTATPVTGSAIEGLGKTNLQARQGPPLPRLPGVTIQDILNLATATFAVQLVGAQSRREQIDGLCNNFDPTLLGASGYNVTLFYSITCEALAVFKDAPNWQSENTPSRADVKALTAKFSTYIWIFQAFGAMDNDPARLSQLCNLLTPVADQVGLDFNLVQRLLCVGGVGTPLPKVVDLPLPFSDLRQGNATVVKRVSSGETVRRG
ncbi:MAG: hypothetical protein Q9169_003111 [Polycauliona sp. 2 TL-2023]